MEVDDFKCESPETDADKLIQKEYFYKGFTYEITAPLRLHVRIKNNPEKYLGGDIDGNGSDDEADISYPNKNEDEDDGTGTEDEDNISYPSKYLHPDDGSGIDDEANTNYVDRSTTKLFLDEFKKRKHRFRDPKMKKLALWREIQEALRKHGKNVSAEKLSEKFRNLKRTYLTIKKRENTYGPGKIVWAYMNYMDEIFNSDPNINFRDNFQSATKKISRVDSRAKSDVNSVNKPRQQTVCLCSQGQSARRKSIKKAKAKKQNLNFEKEKIHLLRKINENLVANRTIQGENMKIFHEGVASLVASMDRSTAALKEVLTRIT